MGDDWQEAWEPETDGPDLAPIRAIHRADDGYIALTRHVTGQDGNRAWEEMGMVKAGDLHGMFPSIRDFIMEDSYFSANAMYQPRRNAKSRYPGLQPPRRKKENLRYLNACYADVDCHTIGLTDVDAIAEILRMQDGGTLPPASIITRSGRGVWAFWLLRDERAEDDSPQRAFPDKQLEYYRIQATLHERLKHLGADPVTRTDGARVTRIPGSINTKSDRRVGFWIQADVNGKGYVYRLSELAEMLRLPEPPPKPEITQEAWRERDTPPDKAKKRGYVAMYMSRLRQLDTLETIRGGMQDGTRGCFLWIYAHCMARLGRDDAQIKDTLHQLAERCQPPAGNEQIKAALLSARTTKRFKDATIAHRLKITRREAEALDTWKAAVDYENEPPILEKPKTIMRRHRRVRLQELVDNWQREHRPAPTLREIADLLAGEGIEGSHVTIRRDLEALGVSTGRDRKSTEKRKRRVRRAIGQQLRLIHDKKPQDTDK